MAWGFSIDYDPMAEIDRELRILQQAADLARRIAGSVAPGDRLQELEKQRQQALAGFQEQIEQKESTQADPEALAQLQALRKQLDAEKAQRIAELEEKFHLKVAVAPVTASIVKYPMAEYRYVAVAGSKSIPFMSSQDLLTGGVRAPNCGCCSGPMAEGYACECGHLACPVCHRVCSGCGIDLCSACVTLTCPICKGAVCEHCKRVCAVCGLTGCRVDVAGCPCCGKSVCNAHSRSCPICGQRICADCVAAEGCCTTCKSLFPATSSLSAVGQLLSTGEKQVVAKRGRWLIGENKDAFVLVRRGLRLRACVVDKTTGCVRSDRTLGLLDTVAAKRMLR